MSYGSLDVWGVANKVSYCSKELSDHELEGTPEMDDADNEPERIYRSIDVSLPRHPVPNPGNDDVCSTSHYVFMPTNNHT